MDEKFGKTFQVLRKRKGFKVTGFESVGISKSAISSFERGLTDLGAERFYRALKLMETPLYEFEQILNDFHQGVIDETFRTLYPAYYGQDTATIKQILSKTHDPILKMAIKCLLYDLVDGEKLTQKEQELAAAYFFEVEEWGIYELSALTGIIMELSVKQIIAILRYFREDVLAHQSFTHYRHRVIHICCRGAMALILHMDKFVSREVLDYTLDYTNTDDLFGRTMIHFVKGFWTARFENRAEGKKRLNEAVTIFKTLNSEIMASFFQSRIDRHWPNL